MGAAAGGAGVKLSAIYLAAPVDGVRTFSRDVAELTDNDRGVVVRLSDTRRIFVPWSNVAGADLWPEPPTVPLPATQRGGKR